MQINVIFTVFFLDSIISYPILFIKKILIATNETDFMTQ